MNKLTNEYFYIHNICYWYGNSRIENLKSHIEAVKNVPLSKSQHGKNLVIISLMCDEESQIDDPTINSLTDLGNELVDVEVIPWFNSGGTTRSMWNVYKNLKERNITSKYFGTWEDDYLFAKEMFLDDAAVYLERGNLFVGALWTPPHITFGGEFGTPPTAEHNYDRMVEKGYKYPPPSSHLLLKGGECYFFSELKEYRWCEDPYIMKYENLSKIENLIGRFTHAPSEKYIHWDHGVVHGEVGFPSRLHLSGAKFFGIEFDKIFKFLNNASMV